MSVQGYEGIIFSVQRHHFVVGLHFPHGSPPNFVSKIKRIEAS